MRSRLRRVHELVERLLLQGRVRLNEVLAADYYWLYDDGWGPNGTINGDCNEYTGQGCWSHRDAVLDPFNGLRTLIMGAATAPATWDGNTVFTMVFVGTNQPPPPLRFTWKKIDTYH